jgi:hypothetical protein
MGCAANVLSVMADGDPCAADPGRGDGDGARKVVWAFDTPPSQRPLPPGANAASRLHDPQIEALYGPRYRDGWVAVFERRGWEAPPGHGSPPERDVVLERVYFLVGSDVRGLGHLLAVLRSAGRAGSYPVATPYLLWHMADRDALWRVGVVPITAAQVPSKPLVGGGNANQPLV